MISVAFRGAMLFRTGDGKKVKLYYHKVLEAKIAFSDNGGKRTLENRE